MNCIDQEAGIEILFEWGSYPAPAGRLFDKKLPLRDFCQKLCISACSARDLFTLSALSF